MVSCSRSWVVIAEDIAINTLSSANAPTSSAEARSDVACEVDARSSSISGHEHNRMFYSFRNEEKRGCHDTSGYRSEKVDVSSRPAHVRMGPA